MQPTLYIIYKITNTINGKTYIGKHQTTDINDSYLGSGKLLLYAISKYGRENFRKEILFVFDTADKMNNKEKELVNEQYVNDPNTYNLKVGGDGGWDHINNNEEFRKQKNKRARKAANIAIKEKYGVTNTSQLPHVRELNSLRMKERHANGESTPPPSFKGKHHTTETKNKIGIANSKHQAGSKNSQFGTIWITDGKQNSKIPKCEEIPAGWYRGRVMRNTP